MKQMIGGLENWAGNLRYGAADLCTPATVEEVQQVVFQARRLKALGSRHSFSRVADTDGTLVSLDGLHGIVALDPARRRVTVEAGIRYGELARALAAHGFALPNMASLPHISVGGAVATGTHGSGDALGSLATPVEAMEIVRADGTLVGLSRGADGDLFDGAVVHLGALGVVARLTLAIEPAYEMRQDVFERLPFEEALGHFDAITTAGTSVSLFTTWAAPEFHQVWIKRRTPAPDLEPTFFGATRADGPRHPILGMPVENCTEQMGVPGPWYERLPHFRMEFTPSSGEELQSEYLLPRGHAVDALRAIDAMRDQIAPLVQVSEIRTVAPDPLWLSGAYGRPTVALHFTWVADAPAVNAVLPRIEAALSPFSPRPHWGKLSATPPAELALLYPRLPDFRRLRDEFDPDGKFENPFLQALLRQPLGADPLGSAPLQRRFGVRCFSAALVHLASFRVG